MSGEPTFHKQNRQKQKCTILRSNFAHFGGKIHQIEILLRHLLLDYLGLARNKWTTEMKVDECTRNDPVTLEYTLRGTI